MSKELPRLLDEGRVEVRLFTRGYGTHVLTLASIGTLVGRLAEAAKLLGHDCQATAESRGIAKGKAEMLRWLRANWSADWGKTICDMEDAILSVSQPQEMAGEGCVWVEHCQEFDAHLQPTADGKGEKG